MKQRFRSLALERLDRLERGWPALAEQPDNTSLQEEVLREAHSLKGEARMMGLTHISELGHLVEEAMHQCVDQAFHVGTDVLSVVLFGFDLLRRAVYEESVDVDAYEVSLTKALAQTPKTAETVVSPKVSTAIDTDTSSMGTWRNEDFLRVGLGRVDALTELVGDLGIRHERHKSVAVAVSDQGQELALGLRRARAALAMFSPDQDKSVLVGVLVEVQRLIGELEPQAQVAARGLDLAREQAFDDSAQLRALDRLLRDLRLLPLDALFEQVPRGIRDLAAQQGKQVTVRATGGDVQADKRVLDRLAEPLLHLIRNCVDHGLESPQERLDAGKPVQGAIVLSAVQLGSSVEVVVQDDGRGIDFEAVRAAAVQRGFLNEDEARELSASRLHELLFHSGLTTRDEVSEISGRGVGLAAVAQCVDELAGSIRVSSEWGAGTRFTLRVPVSVVLSQVLVVSVGQCFFAVPADSVDAVYTVTPQALEQSGRGLIARVGEVSLPSADLAVLTGISGEESSEDVRMVVLKHNENRLALRVDRFHGNRAVVQRPLEAFIEDSRLVQGSVSLPSGSLALILDAEQVIRESMFRSRWRQRRSSDQEQVKRVLVVDDSEFTRDMVVGLLREMAFDVFEAVDGARGLNAAKKHSPDLILTDLDMPVMDGFAMVEQLRKQPEFAGTPIIVLSTRGSNEDKARARAAGADAYLVKSDFREDELARTLQRFLDTGGET